MQKHNLKLIRVRLGLSQAAMGEAIGCKQSNVALMEQGQVLMPPTAIKVKELAARRGLELSLDQIYGLDPLPKEVVQAEPSATQGVGSE